MRRPKTIATLLVLGWLLLPGLARALAPEDMAGLAIGDNDARVAVLARVVAAGDGEAIPFLRHLLNDEIKIDGERLLLVVEDSVTDAVSGEAAEWPETAEDVVNNNRMRNRIEGAIAALSLRAGTPAERLAAARTLREADPGEAALLLVRQAEQVETDGKVRSLLTEIRAGIELRGEDRALRLRAARELAESSSAEARQLLASRLLAGAEPDEEVRAAVQSAVDDINRRLSYYEWGGVLFSGLSLGSVLLLAALGLAITYGLMGVINMAHGEMMMLGAYATFVVQNLFRQYLPGWFDAYLLAAIPAAFAVTALIGMLLERSVIRHLYGRPLETLLATWGISLILMQLVRSLFGAQNVQVENPVWMSGGIELASNLVLPYNRIVIIGFAFGVLLLVWALLNKTRLGLFVRAVTQNRTMAGCVGVNTQRVDAWAFALGSGIAGLAGVALAQIGNVGPDLGKTYIVDSFMVVVVGGVGQLAGAVYAALGLGVASKFLEGYAGAVLAKIIVLVIIIVFIQKRPQGIFALKGRSAD